MSPIRTPLHDLLLKLQADLDAIGYDMLTPTASTTGPERWTIEIQPHEEPMELDWTYNRDGGLLRMTGSLTRTQALHLRAHLDEMIDRRQNDG